jgi:2'-5' RNA ligase
MRTFIAVEISESTRNTLAQVISDIKLALGRLSWVRPENMHVTLKFLGEIQNEREENIAAALQAVARDFNPFGYEAESLGCFPNPRRARVLWAGMRGSLNTFTTLAESVDKAMNSLGFRKETRPFSPHITLARIRKPIKPQLLVEAIEQYQGEFFGDEWVEGISLMKSDLKPDGAVYTRLSYHCFA